ncbi:phage protein [Kitasatospora sp. Ki12]
MLPAVQAGQRTIASLTAGYLEQMHREVLGTASPRIRLDPDEVSGAAVRNGADPADVYRRPFKVTWKTLSDCEPFDVAQQRGAARLEILAKTDLQLARTHTTRLVLSQQPQVKYYVRELRGEFDCALCMIASTQRYRKENLLPIHPGCDCGVRTVRADYDPGQVVDEARLEAIHAAVESAVGRSARDARAVDYSKIIIQREHGEIGPVLGFRGQSFTGPNDLRPPS